MGRIYPLRPLESRFSKVTLFMNLFSQRTFPMCNLATANAGLAHLHSTLSCGRMDSRRANCGRVRAVDSKNLAYLAKRTIWAAIAFILHGCLIAVTMAVVKATELLYHFFWIDSPFLFGRVSLSWFFDALDGAAFLLFGTWGIYEAFQILRGKK